MTEYVCMICLQSKGTTFLLKKKMNSWIFFVSFSKLIEIDMKNKKQCQQICIAKNLSCIIMKKNKSKLRKWTFSFFFFKFSLKELFSEEKKIEIHQKCEGICR